MICAICDRTNRTTRLCKTCRRDPANKDWRQFEAAVASGTIDRIIGAARRFADLQANRTLRPSPVKEEAILRLLCEYSIQRPSDLRAPYTKHPRWVWQSDDLTYREIAHLVDSDERYVRKIVRKILGSR